VIIGSYRGLTLSVKFNSFNHKLSIKGIVTCTVDLGADPRGNITRIDNALDKISGSFESWKSKLSNLLQQQEVAKVEVGKPFEHEKNYNKSLYVLQNWMQNLISEYHRKQFEIQYGGTVAEEKIKVARNALRMNA